MQDRHQQDEIDDAESSDGIDEEECLDETLTAGDGRRESQPIKNRRELDWQQLMPSHEEVDDELSDIELPEQIEDVEEQVLEEEDLIPPDQNDPKEE